MKNKRKIFEAPIDEPTGFSINPDLKRAIERGETPLGQLKEVKHHFLIVHLFLKRVKMIDNHLKKLQHLKDLEML